MRPGRVHVLCAPPTARTQATHLAVYLGLFPGNEYVAGKTGQATKMLASSFINSVVDNRFAILRVLGQGGMGIVFLAEQMDLNRMVALKILEESLAEDDECKARFLREGKVLGSLMHPNIVCFYQFGFVNDLPYLAMECLKGKSLKQEIKESGGMHWRAATKLILQLCAAMQYVHDAGIVHRDLKPNNIILLEDQPGQIKLLDFGLASIKDLTEQKQKLTATGLLIGSVQYMSPEQCLGRKADHRSDIYAVACIFYEMLCGYCPFDADSAIGLLHKHISGKAEPITKPYKRLREHSGDKNANCPPALERVLQRCMEKDPEARYQSMEELATDLKLILENREAESAFLSNTDSRASEHEKDSRLLLIITGVLLAGLIAFLAYKQNVERATEKKVFQEKTISKTTKLSNQLAGAASVNLLAKEVEELYLNGMTGEGMEKVQAWLIGRKRRGFPLTVQEDVDTTIMLGNGEANLLRHDLASARLEKKYQELLKNPEFNDHLKIKLLQNKGNIDGWTGNTALLLVIEERIQEILNKSTTLSSMEKAYHLLGNSAYLQQCKKFDQALEAIENARKECLKQGDDAIFTSQLERTKASIYYHLGKVREAQKSIEKAFEYNSNDGLAMTSRLVSGGLNGQFAASEENIRRSLLAGMQAEAAASTGYSKIAVDMLSEQLKGPVPKDARAQLLCMRAESTLNTWSTTGRNRGVRFDRIKHRQQWLNDNRWAANEFMTAYNLARANTQEFKRQALAWRHACLCDLGEEKAAEETLKEALVPVGNESANEARASVAKCVWVTGSLFTLHGYYPECIAIFKKAMELYQDIPGMENQYRRAKTDYASALEKWRVMQKAESKK